MTHVLRTEKIMKVVEAEINAPIVSAQLVHFHNIGSNENVLCGSESYRVDLSLTPRQQNARVCYREHWSPHRFEPLGKIFLLPPNETFVGKGEGANHSQATILCHLRPEPMREWFEGDLEWTDHRLTAGLNISNANIRQLMLRLHEEMKHPGFASDVLVEVVGAQIAIELGRYCTAVSERSTKGGLATWRMRLIEERLREVYEAPTLTELAGVCHMSVRQLARAFRASRNCSIGDYVAQCRIENAKKLLESEESIKAIAHSLGFASSRNFSEAFRRVAGESPNKYRQRARAKVSHNFMR